MMPSKKTWIEAATKAAEDARVRPSLVMGGGKSGPVVLARWRAWRTLKETNPAYSLAGIGRVSGYHHTSVRYGILRDRGEDDKIGYKFQRARRMT